MGREVLSMPPNVVFSLLSANVDKFLESDGEKEVSVGRGNDNFLSLTIEKGPLFVAFVLGLARMADGVSTLVSGTK